MVNTGNLGDTEMVMHMKRWKCYVNCFLADTTVRCGIRNFAMERGHSMFDTNGCRTESIADRSDYSDRVG